MSNFYKFLLLAIFVPAVFSSNNSYALSVSNENVQSSNEVMVIRFNQKTVYFRNPMRKVIAKVNETKSNAKYELVSIDPAGSAKNEANGKDFDENLRNVANTLHILGVPVENISYKHESSNSVENQEVKVFIR